MRQVSRKEFELVVMNRVSCFMFGIAVGIAGLYITMHFTLVRTADGFHLIPKIAAKVEMPYEDVRTYTIGNWQKKQTLAMSILRANKGHLLQNPTLLGFKESSQRLLDQWSGRSKY